MCESVKTKERFLKRPKNLYVCAYQIRSYFWDTVMCVRNVHICSNAPPACQLYLELLLLKLLQNTGIQCSLLYACLRSCRTPVKVLLDLWVLKL
jgi:hypothetical protein